MIYLRGNGTARDYVQAFKWFDISRQMGLLDGLWQRDQVKKEMTADQISEAERLAEEWMEQRE